MITGKSQTYNDILMAKAAKEYFEEQPNQMLPQGKAPVTVYDAIDDLLAKQINQYSKKYRKNNPKASERNVRRAVARHFNIKLV